MFELAEAEQEQESWFNQSVRGATKSEDKHIQWAGAVVEEPAQDWQIEDADSSESDSEYDEDEDLDVQTAGFASLQRVSSRSSFQSMEVDHEEEEEEDLYEDDGEEDYAMLTLSRTQSHPPSPPELSHDSEDDSSEDESMPSSPLSDALPSFTQIQRQSAHTKLSPSEQAAFFDGGFYLPNRASPSLVSAVSVY